MYLSIAFASIRFLFILNTSALRSLRRYVVSLPSSPSPPQRSVSPPSSEHSAITSSYTFSTAARFKTSSSYAASPPIVVSSRSHANANDASAASCAPDPTSSIPVNVLFMPNAPPKASYSSSDASSDRSAHSKSGDASPSVVRCAVRTASSSPSARRSASRVVPGMSHSSSSMHPGSGIVSSTLSETQKPNRSKSSSLACDP